MSLGGPSERMLLESGLGADSMDRVRDLCLAFRKRLVARDEEADIQRERSTFVQNALNTLMAEEATGRENLGKLEQKGFEKLDRIFNEYRHLFLNEAAENEKRARFEKWRNVEIRKLEQEKYRKMHATLLREGK